MPDLTVEMLLHKYPRISDQVDERELRVILSELSKQLDRSPRATIVELGCYIGTASLFIRRLQDAYQAEGEFHVYDSFAGLPSKTSKDSSPAGEHFKPGELSISRKAFELQFKKAGLKLPVIHKGWFEDLTDTDIPSDISFAFLDGDYYRSIMTSLKLVWPRLLPGAVVVVDDYANEALPGASRAVDEWLVSHRAGLRVESSLAILTLH